MVRVCSIVPVMRASSPHTRGDGPLYIVGPHDWDEFSPHAWGWSDSSLGFGAGTGVLPTRVGMVRYSRPHSAQTGSSPHTRGDGPEYMTHSKRDMAFSPHAWGWSGNRHGFRHCQSVLPTRVGMVRIFKNNLTFALCSPHTRGDGPIDTTASIWSQSFSPHAWGWSGDEIGRPLHRVVLPTRVGMVRRGVACVRCAAGSPHTRGDGPASHRFYSAHPKFSPHAWGWSGHRRRTRVNRRVLPTRVRMVRNAPEQHSFTYGSPHTRGDGPSPLRPSHTTEWFSPHAWGWSEIPFVPPSGVNVLPTRVGMVRTI